MSIHCRIPFLALVFAASGLSTLAQTSLETRLERLESEVGALRKENQQLRSELGLEGRAGQTIVKPAGREPVLSLGGLVQAQADLGDKGDARFTSGNDRFYLRRARINAQGKFLEEFDFRVEVELAGSLAEATGHARPAYGRLHHLESFRFRQRPRWPVQDAFRL
jgi:hypothetical protein